MLAPEHDMARIASFGGWLMGLVLLLVNTVHAEDTWRDWIPMAPELPPKISVGTVGWLNESAQRYREECCVGWNTDYRPGRAAVGVACEYVKWTARELDSVPYLDGAEMRELYAYALVEVPVLPGVLIRAEAGTAMIQVRPAADTSYDAYRFGYLVGLTVSGALPMWNFGALVANVNLRTTESRSKDRGNTQVVQFGGNDVVLRNYLLSGDILFMLELYGKRNVLSINIYGGASAQVNDGRFHGASTMRYRVSNSGVIVGLAGIKISMSNRVAFQVRALMGVRFAPQASLQILFD